MYARFFHTTGALEADPSMLPACLPACLPTSLRAVFAFHRNEVRVSLTSSGGDCNMLASQCSKYPNEDALTREASRALLGYRVSASQLRDREVHSPGSPFPMYILSFMCVATT
jgi:hypothetical protein